MIDDVIHTKGMIGNNHVDLLPLTGGYFSTGFESAHPLFLQEKKDTNKVSFHLANK